MDEIVKIASFVSFLSFLSFVNIPLLKSSLWGPNQADLKNDCDSYKKISFLTQLIRRLAKQKSRRHTAKKIIDADYADDLAILADYLKDATSLLALRQ